MSADKKRVCQPVRRFIDSSAAYGQVKRENAVRLSVNQESPDARVGLHCPISRRTNTTTENPNQSLAVSQAAVSLSRCEQSRTTPQRNVSLGTDTGWLFEIQQPISALAFLTTGATVLVTTIDLECTTRAIGFFGTTGTAGLLAQGSSAKGVMAAAWARQRLEFSECAQSIACAGDNDCVN